MDVNADAIEFARACVRMLARGVEVAPPPHAAGLGPCLVWPGAATGFGHGHVRIGDQTLAVHRMAYMLEHGFIPGAVLVLHRCDNPPCFRGSHLFVGTQAVNVADAVAKGRIARGSDLPQAKLDETSVVEIKRLLADGVRGITLAAQFGVTQQTVCDIKKGRKWAWVTG